MGSENDLIIVHPKTGVKMIVDSRDQRPLTWEACANIKGEWRMPDIDELEAIYMQLHKMGKGNFKNESYWSGSEFSSDSAWYYDFDKGMDGTGNVIFTARVRLVKNE